MREYELSLNDIKENYFHFTLKTNLDSIEKKGLVPKKGSHAEHIEKTEKVFFVQGLDNLLILFDCWINVYKKVPILHAKSKFYGLGSKAMSSRFFPMFFVDIYFWLIRKSKKHKRYAYKEFDRLLDECILLNLDINEGIDFNFSDIDEIKAKGYRKRHLIELGYSLKYSDMESNKMDSWNLHTSSNTGIDVSKIKLCVINGSSTIRDIVYYAIQNTNLDLKDTCPVLWDYLVSREEI